MWRLNEFGKVGDVSLVHHMLLQQQLDEAVNRGDRMGGLPAAIRVIGEEVGVPVTLRLSLGGRGIKAAGKDLIQLNRHSGESQPHMSGILEAALLHTAQIPPLPDRSFTADPVADLDRAAFLELALQDEFTGTAAALTMKFKPAAADGPIGDQNRCASGRWTMMQNAASRHRESRSRGGLVSKSLSRERTTQGAEVSIVGRLACTTSV